MNYKRFENDIVLRLDPDEDINQCLLDLAEKENITAGSITGIGATDDFTVGVWDMAKGDYDLVHYAGKGNYEITSLVGNFSMMNGERYVHVHITAAGHEPGIVGGHLLKARISLTAEINIHVVNGVVDRKRNEEIGINQIL